MINTHDQQYHSLIKEILETGVRKPNRTGVDTIGIFSHKMKFDLRDGTIPLLTTKKVHTKSIIHELLWMMSGSTNIKYLKENNVSIWDEWANEMGELGKIYGYQWRHWETYKSSDQHDGYFYKGDPIDQVAEVINKLKNNPNDRRLIISAWNVADIPKMALPPCHYVFQFYTKPLTQQQRVFLASSKYCPSTMMENFTTENMDHILDDMKIPKYELSLMMNQRSCDVGLGVPFNIVQYSFMLLMFAEVSNMTVGDFVWMGGDVHIYENHVTQLTEQLERVSYPAPTFKFGRKIGDIDDFKYEDFIINNYQSHPAIKMDVAV